MRKIACCVFLIIFLICSALLVSCDAITAQNISHSGFTPGRGGGPGMSTKRGPAMGSGQGNDWRSGNQRIR